MWWLLGGLVVVGGGYAAYTYYEKQQAATPVGQLKADAGQIIGTGESAAAQAVVIASGGGQSKAVEAAELALPFVNPTGTVHAAESVGSTIESWF